MKVKIKHFLSLLILIITSSEMFASEINVLDHGIIPNDPLYAENNSNKIQQIIDNIDLNGGCLYFPSGIYYINKPIYVAYGTFYDENTKKVNRPIHIRGDIYSNSANLACAGSAIKQISNCNIISVNINEENKGDFNRSYCGLTITDLSLIGNESITTSDYSAIMGYRSRITIKNVLISGFVME